jgi:hypothetical protein
MTVTARHGYGPYTRGCRCGVCRQAKADYSRRRRAAAKETAEPGVTAAGGFTHGTRHGYDEHGCRCGPCTEAQRAAWRRAAAT